MRPVRSALMALAGCHRLMLMPDAADEALGLQVGDGALPAVVFGPRVRPDVELLEVDACDAEVAEAALGAPPDVVGGEDVLEPVVGRRGPLAVLRRDLRGDERRRARPVREHVPDQLLAVAVAVGAGRVEEVAAELEAAPQRRARRLVVRPGPPAHAPGAEAHLGDLTPQTPKDAIVHPCIVPRVRGPDAFRAVNCDFAWPRPLG